MVRVERKKLTDSAKGRGVKIVENSIIIGLLKPGVI